MTYLHCFTQELKPHEIRMKFGLALAWISLTPQDMSDSCSALPFFIVSSPSAPLLFSMSHNMLRDL